VIESAEQLERIDFTRPIYLFSQTTKSVEGFNRLVEAIKLKIEDWRLEISFEYHDTICRSVANRVKELQAFAKANDIVLFVGGTKSSNAKVLFNHCKEANERTFFVSSADEIGDLSFVVGDLIKTNPDLKIGICGATSTPLWLMEAVSERLSAS
jgi:4-hydroxy-3-methylbut-2-enyl diphosphate reductase